MLYPVELLARCEARARRPVESALVATRTRNTGSGGQRFIQLAYEGVVVRGIVLTLGNASSETVESGPRSRRLLDPRRATLRDLARLTLAQSGHGSHPLYGGRSARLWFWRSRVRSPSRTLPA